MTQRKGMSGSEHPGGVWDLMDTGMDWILQQVW